MQPRPAALPALLAVLVLAPLGALRADPWPAIAIPASNAATLRAPAPRPPSGDADARARLLHRALRTGAPADVEAALAFFLPRDPFLAIKDMSGAAGYFTTLTRWYRRDIAELRRASPWLATSEYEGFQLSRACAWMSPGREANRLPYWSCYRSRLLLRELGRATPRALEVHVMIHWGDQWFVTHLGALRR
ncbi:MAG: hypothetical protein HY909_31740 [Deltaproteobacteria bacterium]|nr:hypothetical protein [Deltaproteobacteria bacterium]